MKLIAPNQEYLRYDKRTVSPLEEIEVLPVDIISLLAVGWTRPPDVEETDTDNTNEEDETSCL